MIEKILLIVTIILFIMLLNFRMYVFNTEYYEEEFRKSGVYNSFPKEEANEQLNKLIHYLKTDQPLTNTFFNEKEKKHLEDVKRLIQKTLIIFYCSIVLLPMLLFRNRKGLTRPFLYSGVLLISIPLVLSIINFQFTFIIFHELLFTNNFWVLNPETDNLIKLFPEQFFYDT